MPNITRFFYGSSPDRGLEHLLKMWPRIRQELPNCELYVCYGFNLFLKGYSNNPYMMKWYEDMQVLLKQEGVTDFGRVSKDKVDELTRSCDIWAYPTHFEETNGITALRSQQLGCVPVTIKLAGLEDTVYSGLLLDIDITDPEGKETYFKELIKVAKDQEFLKTESEKGKKGIEKFYWENIAKEWANYLK